MAQHPTRKQAAGPPEQCVDGDPCFAKSQRVFPGRRKEELFPFLDLRGSDFAELDAVDLSQPFVPAAGLIIEFCRVRGEPEEVGDDFPERSCVPFDRGPVRADAEHRVKKGTDRNFGSVCCRRRLGPPFIPRKCQGPTVDGEEQEYISRFCRRGRSVWSTKREKCPFALKLDSSVPFLCQSPLAIYDLWLPENGALPESDIGFWKVAKIFHFLATFQVHPWPSLTFHEPVAQMIEWLGKPVQEPISGS